MDNHSDIVGAAHLYGGTNFIYVHDRYNNPKSAIYLHQGFLQVPGGVYFNGDFSMSCWLKLRADQKWVRIIDFGNAQNADNIFITTFGSKSNLGVGSSYDINNKSIFSSRNTELRLEVWYHVATVLKNQTASVYVNGELRSQSAGDMLVPRNVFRTENYFGRSNFQESDLDAEVVLDEMKIYRGALTDQEIFDEFSKEPLSINGIPTEGTFFIFNFLIVDVTNFFAYQSFAY